MSDQEPALIRLMEKRIAEMEAELTQLRILRMRLLPVEPQTYLVWSEEHQAWWHQSRMRYTASIFEAGRFQQREACEIVKQGNAFLDPRYDSPLNEIAIPDPLEVSE
jgi:hypothetical protein